MTRVPWINESGQVRRAITLSALISQIVQVGFQIVAAGSYLLVGAVWNPLTFRTTICSFSLLQCIEYPPLIRACSAETCRGSSRDEHLSLDLFLRIIVDLWSVLPINELGSKVEWPHSGVQWLMGLRGFLDVIPIVLIHSILAPLLFIHNQPIV